MHDIHDHKVNPVNDTLRVMAIDEPAFGAHHIYEVSKLGEEGLPEHIGNIVFQKGPIDETGVNGLTHEVLLAIVTDRLRAFQTGPFACRENALALTKLEECAMWLAERTRGRMRRGVEGTNKQ